MADRMRSGYMDRVSNRGKQSVDDREIAWHLTYSDGVHHTLESFPSCEVRAIHSPCLAAKSSPILVESLYRTFA
jgi:hypothetical protein